MAFAYYNEIDPKAAEWLRWLIERDMIPNGWVDERSICDVKEDNFDGFIQLHFFAGIGGWALAARMAGWPDDRRLVTGSCPCQPFSVAGKGAGTSDERHLWPDFFRIIRAARPPVVMGEQVAGKAGYGWFDGVAADLATENYASRYVDIPSCAVDAPHIRSRGYWIAVADGMREGRDAAAHAGIHRIEESPRARHGEPERLYGALGEVNAESIGRGEGRAEPEFRGWRATSAGADASERDGLYANADGSGRDGWQEASERSQVERAVAERNYGSILLPDADSRGGQVSVAGRVATIESPLPDAYSHGSNGSFWADYEWLNCHDGKARRAKSGVPLLVDGLPGRVAAWRGFGNAINPVLAAETIRAFLETEGLSDV